MDPLTPDMNKSPADFEDGGAFASEEAAFSTPRRRGVRAPESAEEHLFDKVPPHSVEAEQALLGAVLFKNTALHLVVDIIQPADFYLPAHQLIFNSFLDLYRKNQPVDLITVMETLRAREELEKAGGAGYLLKSKALAALQMPNGLLKFAPAAQTASRCCTAGR